VRARAKLAETRPKTDEQLRQWIEIVTGFRIAPVASCPDHDAPFSWIADLYFERENRVAVLGPRGGGKTLGSACLHWSTGSTRPDYRMAHFGGSMQQASQCQDYIKHIAGRDGVGGLLEGDPRTTWVRWAQGAYLTIHTATVKQASGGHPHRKQADEFDLWKYEVWQQFLGMGMTTADPNAAAVQTIYTSTRSRKYGMMHQLLQDAPKKRIRIYRFCVWDVKAPCVPCVQDRCWLWDYCQGKHADSQGHMPRSVITDKAMQMDPETIRTELFCEAPSTRGLCWASFDDVAREGSNVTPAAEYNPEWPVFWGCDDNYEQPRCIALCQEDPNTGFIHVFDEYYLSHRMASEAVRDILEDEERYPYKPPEYAIPDPTAKELAGALHRANIPTFAPLNYRRVEGVKVVRRFVQDARGTRMLLLHPRCVNIKRSMAVHHFKELPMDASGEPRFSDEPEKHTDDHGADVMCYVCWIKRGMA